MQTYKLFDTQTKEVIATYKNVKAARSARDRKNFDFGAVRYTVKVN